MRHKWTWIVRAVLPGMMVCALLCLGMGAAKAPTPKMSPEMRKLMDALMAGKRVPEQPGLWINHTKVDWSFEEREQMDFLLTPALLVQEAVSDGVILTYPEE